MTFNEIQNNNALNKDANCAAGSNPNNRLAMESSEEEVEPLEDSRRCLFDTFDWDNFPLSGTGPDGDFSALASPSPISPIPKHPCSTPSAAASQGSLKLFSNLPSAPDFTSYSSGLENKYARDIRQNDCIYVAYTTADFLSLGRKPRSSRRVHKKSRKTAPRSSRQLKTFGKRLEEFRPCLKYKIMTTEGWTGTTCVKDIISMSTMACSEGEGLEEEAFPFAADNKQGIGFKEYPYSIVVIGYILKIASIPSTILSRFCSNISILPLPMTTKLIPLLFLEDLTGKIQLDLTRCEFEDRISFEGIVSGVPVAIKGLSAEGKLWVEDVVYATPPAPELPLALIGNEAAMVFVSGLHIGKPFTNWAAIGLLFDYLQGLSGSEAEQERVVIKQTRVFFLGNLFYKGEKWNPERREWLIAAQCDVADRIDKLLEGLTQTMEVFIIPGEHDPTYQTSLPQPAIHKQLFSTSAHRSTLHSLSNPAKISFQVSCSKRTDGHSENIMDLILSSGANIKESMNHCEIDCPMEMCIKNLEWSHLNPESIDDGQIAEEIFTISKLPHIFAVGGLSDFQIKKWNEVMIIGVPSFSSTETVMVLKNNGDIVPMCFKMTV